MNYNFKFSNFQKKLYIHVEFIKSASHLGHRSLMFSTQKGWHPFLADYLLGTKNKVCIINTKIIKEFLLKALFIITLNFRSHGRILIVNTNPEFSKIFQDIYLILSQKNFQKKKNESGSFILSSPLLAFCNNKWIGGTLTNWKQLSKSVLTFAKFSKRFDKFMIKNNINFPRYKKMKKCFRGLVFTKNQQIIYAFQQKPDLIFLVNPNENRNVIEEARLLNIPVIALIDSNTDLTGITLPIPSNINSINFTYFFFNWILRILKNS